MDCLSVEHRGRGRQAQAEGRQGLGHAPQSPRRAARALGPAVEALLVAHVGLDRERRRVAGLEELLVDRPPYRLPEDQRLALEEAADMGEGFDTSAFPDAHRVILRDRAYLLSVQRQTVPARRRALEDAEALFAELGSEEDRRVRDMASSAWGTRRCRL
jgi:hypothetical protein